MAITVTYTFVDGTTIVAAEVNQNFTDLTTDAFDKTGDTATGACTFSGGVTSSSTTTLSGATVVSSTTTLSGATVVSGTTTLSGLLVASGTTTLSGATVISGTTTISGGLSLSTALPAASGGTGRGTHTAYAVLCGGTTTTAAQQSIASVGTSGELLGSNGAGALPTIKTPKTQIRLSSAEAGVAAGLTRYCGQGTTDATAANTEIMEAVGGTLRNLYVALSSAPGGTETYTITVMVNGGATALACTITGASQTGTDLGNTVAIVASDRVTLRVVTSGSAATATVKAAALLL